MIDFEDVKICIVGLGYVGLPLAIGFCKRFDVVGYDIDHKRVSELKVGFDKTKEVSNNDIAYAKSLLFTNCSTEIAECNVFIVTVPTPIDASAKPDLSFLEHACKIVGGVLKRRSVVVFESTVYPGATETFCIPILEKISGQVLNEDFSVGYSPERINPGDKSHVLSNVVKVVSASNSLTLEFLNRLYGEIIQAGVCNASSIQVAEAAKVIENTQRDVNIALVNEFAIIFNKLDIDTTEILEVASTKWNFLKFYPGLVGGHCIGVDPYYLTHCAQSVGHNPELILAGRRINEEMSNYVVGQLIKCMLKKQIEILNSKILVLGLTFKENCPDTRNSKVFDIIQSLTEYGCQVDVYDPFHNVIDDSKVVELNLISEIEQGIYDAILVTVKHKEFQKYSTETIRSYGKRKHVIYDLKNVLDKDAVDIKL